MTPRPDRFGVIRLSAPQLQHPELLTGLEKWLQLGLLSQSQVQQFCQEALTCALPILEPVEDAVGESIDLAVSASKSSDDRTDRVLVPELTGDFADAVSPESSPVAAAPSPLPTSWLTRSLQTVMAEIGVIWLLCLGVFMVVVSSGVLAASQWQNFSPIGQYGILLTYTLAFGGVSWWTGRQPALQVTTRMLQTATLLIIPVNFWMMDGLQLWQSGGGVALNLLAALILTGVTIVLTARLSTTAPYRLTLLNSLGLSWLHWGWAIAGIPLVATYVGTIGTALLAYLRARRVRLVSLDHPNHSDGLDHPDSSDHPDNSPSFSLTTLIIALATLLLLGRAILAAQVPIDQLGLAFGVCGWLFCWLTRQASRQPFAHLWTAIGAGLLLLGWGVTVNASPPWQAVAISGLALWLLGDRLRRQGTAAELRVLLLIGLQTYGLLWRMLPSDWRQGLIATATQLMGVDGMPIVLLGLAGFPYLWLMLAGANRLRQRQRPDLARTTELIGLGLGGLGIFLSLANPIVRSLTLSLSAVTLIATLRHRSLRSVWLYLTHTLILVAIIAWIDAYLPNLSALAWAQILLVGMVIESGLSIGPSCPWRRSCWHFGLGLAGLSYAILSPWLNGQANVGNQNLLWLIAPVLLAGLARLRQFHSSQLAGWLSSAGLIAELFLLNAVSGWMISLAIGTGVMLVNTLTVQHWLAAVLTIGFGLGFEATVLDYFLSAHLTFDWVMLILAANLWLLWLSESWLMRGDRLGHLYGASVNLWAIAIGLFSLMSLSLHSFAVYGFDVWTTDWVISIKLVISSGLIALAMAYHLWRRSSGQQNSGLQGSTNWGFYGLAWATELFAVTLIGWLAGSIETLAIVTLALGLITQIAGDVWVRRSRQPYRPSWHLIPLLYAGLGTLLGHHSFTATTGLYTLAAALIGIGVGRRMTFFKPLTLVALLAASIAAYELLIYQLMQAPAGSLGDGVILLAGLATLIAVGDRLCQGWLLPYLRLSSQELGWVAHLHWGMGSGLAWLALFLTVTDKGFPFWLLFTTILSLYALINGRIAPDLTLPNSTPPDIATPTVAATATATDRWTYLGILEAWGVLGYLLYRIVPDSVSLAAWAATLAAVVAVLMYFLPWRSWGWSRHPWCRMAMLLPGLIVAVTATEITLQSLLIVAAFYAWIAKAERRPRLSYLSIGLFDWAALRFLNTEGWLNITWLSGLLAVSLLYAAQIDPALQSTVAREQRHWLRSLAVGLLSLTLFYQAEIEVDPTALLIRLLTVGLAIGLIFLGLVLRVRAFLYVGTVTFILEVLRLLWLFINNYSLLLWAIGILIGLMFIWLAATFEARRSQMGALMQYWLTEFSCWE